MFSNRIAIKAVERLATQFPVIGITGPRQSGKTTLAKMAFPNKKYVSFDDKDIKEMAKSSPADFIKAFPDGAVFDEAQKVPEIFDAIKYNIDNGVFEPGKFIVTGSSQFRLSENMSDSLAGRIGLIKLLPFSVEELKNSDLLEYDVYDLILRGMYPPLYDRSKHFIMSDWFDNYIDTYIDYDVKDQITAKNLSDFRKFIMICAAHSGKMLSMESISKDLGVSAPTIKSWLSILESSYIITMLDPDYNNLGKAVVKTPKMYFLDSGLLCHLLRINTKEELLLSPYKGAVVETFAVSELLKKRYNDGKRANLSFYRTTKGMEVDVIANWDKSMAIEIKSSTSSDKNLSTHLQKYIDDRNNDNISGMIYYLGDITCQIGDIKYVSWKDW